jgi:DNA-binding MarR family transcriptional regulator
MHTGRARSTGVRATPRRRERSLDLLRMRLVSTVLDVSYREGIVAASASRVAELSGISERELFEVFPTWEACLGETFDFAATSAVLASTPAAGDASLADSVRARLFSLLTFLDREPRIAWFLMVDSLAADELTRRRRERLREQLAAWACRHAVTEQGFPVDRFIVESMLAVVLGAIHHRLLASERGGETRPLLDLFEPLAGVLLSGAAADLPGSGRDVAANEGEAAPWQQRSDARTLQQLTYRSARVLCAVSANPGATNRTVANAAGIADAGQTSKLLARLARGGLLDNLSAGRPKHRANRWFLTDRGQRTLESIRNGSWPESEPAIGAASDRSHARGDRGA